MRKTLENLDDDNRYTFVATFERFGKKHGYMGEEKTVLLKDVKLEGTDKILTNHLWFNCTKGFEQAHLNSGDLVQFDGRIELYEKGYFGRREDVYVPYSVDYKICRPTKIVNLTKPQFKSHQKRRSSEEVAKEREQKRLERIEREEAMKRAQEEAKYATDNQLEYIQVITETLGLEVPHFELKEDASKWIDQYSNKYRALKASKRGDERRAVLIQKIIPLKERDMTVKDICRELNICSGTYYRCLKDLKEKTNAKSE